MQKSDSTAWVDIDSLTYPGRCRGLVLINDKRTLLRYSYCDNGCSNSCGSKNAPAIDRLRTVSKLCARGLLVSIG